MPRGDRTGPDGLGPMTGRGLGFCAGYASPGYTQPGPGLGRGRGRAWGGRGFGGGGRGFGGYGYRFRGYGYTPPAYPPAYQAPAYSPEDERAALEREIKYMEDDVKAAKDRLAKLNTQGEDA